MCNHQWTIKNGWSWAKHDTCGLLRAVLKVRSCSLCNISEAKLGQKEWFDFDGVLYDFNDNLEIKL